LLFANTDVSTYIMYYMNFKLTSLYNKYYWIRHTTYHYKHVGSITNVYYTLLYPVQIFGVTTSTHRNVFYDSNILRTITELREAYRARQFEPFWNIYIYYVAHIIIMSTWRDDDSVEKRHGTRNLFPRRIAIFAHGACIK